MKRTVWLVLLAATALGMAAPANSQLNDGDFNLATSGTTTSNSGWDLIVSMPDGNNAAAQFQTGFANANNTAVGGTQPPGTGTGIWFRSFEGNQGGSGENLAHAVLSQSVIAGSNGYYVLDFVAGRDVNFTARVFSVALSTTKQRAEIDLLAASGIPDGNLGSSTSGNPGGTPFSIFIPDVLAGDLCSP